MKDLPYLPLLMLVYMWVGNPILSIAQDRDQLKAKLQEPLADTARTKTYLEVAETYLPLQPDSAAIWVDRATRSLDDGLWMEPYLITLAYLMEGFKAQSNFAKADKYAQHLINNFAQHQNPVSQVKAICFQAFILALLGDTEDSKERYKDLKIFLDTCYIPNLDDRLDCQANYFAGLGVTTAIANDPNTALAYFLHADSLMQLGGSEKMRFHIKYCVGTIFLELGLYENSIEFYLVLITAHEEGHPVNVMSIYDNIAMAYNSLGQRDVARKYLAKNLLLARKNGDSATVAFNYKNNGLIYQSEKRYQLAIECYKKGAGVYSSVGDSAGYVDLLSAYVYCCLEGNIELNKCLPIAEELVNYYNTNELFYRRGIAYECRARLLHLLGQYEEAFRDYMMYDSLNTAYLKSSFSEQTAAMETQYQTNLHKREAEKQSELAELIKVESEGKTRLLVAVGGAAVLFLVILIALLVLYRRLMHTKTVINAQKANIEKREAEKTTLLKELHHRVKNNLQIVSSLLNLQGEAVKDEVAQGAFKNGRNRVEAMAMIHRYLYATDELTTLEVKNYLTQLVRSIAYSYGYDNHTIHLNFEITSKPIDVDLAIPLGLIANELVSNAFKHAYKEVEEPSLHLSLTLESDLALVICDNGPGMVDVKKSGENFSFGMELVQSLSKQLKANLEYTYQNGACLQLTIPEAVVTKNQLSYA